MTAKYLPAAQVRVRYGGVSHMWILRKQATEGFPQHATRFGGRRRWWLASDLDAWDAAQLKGQS